MKKILSLLIAAFFIITAHTNAQLKVALRVGVHSTDIEAKEFLVTNKDDVNDLSLSLEEADYGFHAGLMFLVDLGVFYIQPEALYNTGSSTFAYNNLNEPGDEDQFYEQRYHYLDFPVMLGLKFGPLRLGAGPVAHVLLNSTSDLADIDGFQQDLRSLTLGYQAGIGLDIWKLHFDLRYEGNLSGFGDRVTIGGETYDFSSNPTRIIGTVGFRF